MNISVLVKQTFATEARIQLTANGRMDPGGVKQIVNPYDEFAVEEALRIRDAHGGTVRVFCLGTEAAVEAIRHCLAMGADEAVRIEAAALPDDPAIVARRLAAAVARYPFDILLAGRVAIDTGAGQVAGRLAELLDLPFLNVVSRLEVNASGGTAAGGTGRGEVTAHRESDNVTEVLRAKLPALVTAEKGLNEPRYPKLPNVLKANSKPITVLRTEELGVTEPATAGVETVAIELPPPRKGATMLTGTIDQMCDQLIAKLRYEAKVL